MFEQSSLIAYPRCPELYAVQHVALELEFDNAAGYLSLLSVGYSIEKLINVIIKNFIVIYILTYIWFIIFRAMVYIMFKNIINNM